MSVDIKHYFGVGLQLEFNDEKYFDYYEEIEEAHPEYSQWLHERNTTDLKSNVRLIVDGMCGNYVYLIYVIKEVAQEDMYNVEATVEFPFNNIDSQAIVEELQKAYPIFNEDKELPIKDLKMISLFHAS